LTSRDVDILCIHAKSKGKNHFSLVSFMQM